MFAELYLQTSFQCVLIINTNLITHLKQKGGIITIHERILSEQKRIDKQIDSIKSQLKKLPPGKLICSHSGKYSKWFQSNGHIKTYIPKGNRELAEKLAIKKYLSLQLEDLENEKCATQFYLRHSFLHGKAAQLLTKESEYKNLLSSYFSPLSEELSNWANEPYEHNPLYPEQLIHNSASGCVVRSKSESMIDMALYVRKIPFRYECILTLGETVFYPDFTIRHPKTGEVYYWEHFGLMDNLNYSQKVYNKLQHYAVYGIIPSIQLITTYETKERPLTIEKILKISLTT